MSETPARKSPQRLIPLWEGRPLLITTGLLLTLCIAILLVYTPLFVEQTELYLYDSMLSDRKATPKSDVPVMVGIDDASLEAYGQWPWPRYRLSRLLEQLRKLGADVIALDFIMPEPDRTSPEVIMAERGKDLDTSTVTGRSIQSDSNSRKLADTMKKGNTILGYYVNFAGAEMDEKSALPALPHGMVIASTASSAQKVWPRPKSLVRSMPTLTAAASAEGFTNAQHDVDGVLRRAPLLMQYQGQYSPSLALSAVLLSSPERSIQIISDGSETTLAWNNRYIPVDRYGNLMINFRGGGSSYRYLSAKDVLSGTVTADSLRGKIVIVGAWALGLGDIHQIPLGYSLNGLEVHATVIDNILSGTFISCPDWARGAKLFAIILLGIASTWLLSQSGFILSLLTVVVGSCGSYLGGRELLISKGIFVSPLLPMVTPIVVVTVLSLVKYGIEARKVLHRNKDLMEAQDAIIICLSALTEMRDEDTGGHILRTQSYVEILARQLVSHPNFSELDKDSVDLLIKSAPLHDIGKVGIPDSILHKPGSFTDEEFAIIKTHPLIGAKALSKAIDGAANPEGLEFLHYARQMVESHHERWDGKGYPHGLSGTDIPLAGRLMAVADVYDALVSKRIYKDGFSHERAKDIIMKESGHQFDPDVVTALVARSDEFVHISRKYADKNLPVPPIT